MSISDFKQSLMMVNSLIQLENLLNDPPDLNDSSKSAALRASAVILLVSCFETFIKSEIKSFIIEINRKIASDEQRYIFERLPIEIRKEHYFRVVRKFIDIGSNEERIEEIREVYLETYSKKLSGEMFSDIDANPGYESLKRVYKKIGVNNIFNYIRQNFEDRWGRPEVEDYIQQKLQEIVDARNLVTHTMQLNISRRDLKEYYRFIDILSESLSHSLSTYLSDKIIRSIDIQHST